MKIFNKIIFAFAMVIGLSLAVSAQKNDPKKPPPPPKERPPVIEPKPKDRPKQEEKKPKRPDYAYVIRVANNADLA